MTAPSIIPLVAGPRLRYGTQPESVDSVLFVGYSAGTEEVSASATADTICEPRNGS